MYAGPCTPRYKDGAGGPWVIFPSCINIWQSRRFRKKNLVKFTSNISSHVNFVNCEFQAPKSTLICNMNTECSINSIYILRIYVNVFFYIASLFYVFFFMFLLYFVYFFHLPSVPYVYYKFLF